MSRTTRRVRIDRVRAPRAARAQRTDVVFEGVDQAGPSFEVRVFVDNPHADERTEPRSEHGYVGSFHVYGYGAAPGAPFERAPITKYVVATDALRDAIAAGRDVTVTAVTVPYGGNDEDVARALAPARVWIRAGGPD